ncbi:hypothetical protein PENSTE_c001G03426 [Penicillium steckii]|uniref:Uncharacterized protein n=1 Tax=Penicillium steckii TaxID=303698 RepID=A0A1V6TZ88_9EURO|nr:hypothetical protein PENSTE_c001G03426 [Penicillium steckii]
MYKRGGLRVEFRTPNESICFLSMAKETLQQLKINHQDHHLSVIISSSGIISIWAFSRTPMEFQVEYATEADGPGLAKVNIDSFRNQRILPSVFPEASRQSLGEYKAMYSMKHLANPEMHVLKMTDPSTGEIIGYSRWFIPKSLGGETIPQMSEKAQEIARDPVVFAPRPMNEALYGAFRQLLETSRKRFVKDEDMVLDLLAILPEYQGRGLASKFLQWGCSRADQFGVRLYLEATGAGYPVYFKYGWRLLEEVNLDLSQYGAEGIETFTIMMREPQAK